MLKLFLLISLLFWLSGVLPSALDLGYLFAVILIFVGFDRAKAPRLLANNLPIVILSMMSAVSLFDIGVRLLDLFGYPRPEDQLLERSPDWVGAYRFRPNADFNHTTHSDLALMSCKATNRNSREIEFRTDKFGYRNSENHTARPIGIVTLGDSFTYGSGVTQDAIFSSILERTTGAAVYNLALPATPRAEIENLIAQLPNLQLAPNPKIIWTIFEGNDLDDDSPPVDEVVPRSQGFWNGLIISLQNYRQRSPIRRMISGMAHNCPSASLVFSSEVPGVGSMLFYRPYEVATRRSEGEIRSSVGWRNLQQAIVAMRSVRERLNAEVIIVFAPTKERIYMTDKFVPSPLSELIRAESEPHKLKFLDLSASLFAEARIRAGAGEQPIWWLDDTHWSPAGHAEVAQLILSSLREPEQRRSTIHPPPTITTGYHQNAPSEETPVPR